MLNYTICFIKKDKEILLLNRNKKPNMGMWNGVGGKIEGSESHLESIIRETYEETGIILNNPLYVGNVVWKSNNGDGGMYVYLSEIPDRSDVQTPLSTLEGILDWKNIDWILDFENKGVVSNIKHYLPKVLNGEIDLIHQFVYKDGLILEYSTTKFNEYSISESFQQL
ncbi:8-oxo-dGTP diphosphatase [Metasolibacillus sp.]|uniref:NUDIX hydrolase n=1 Tax=Metasolibacillus sp. TaxID=2703680 RepID=UPI0025FF28EB|nr:8-oxo-dGTP diphosphatase [Metasolibacillus sp.]MCT6924252.1 8-oxo-dGTP diphosphatase [Metasolibacillus sp.]MCT6940346.1 8-oxo-dGTP diphosphatase [Metasolibacillus sp.]